MNGQFVVKLAKTEAEKRAAFRLRYDVFVTELSGDSEQVDHGGKLERDRFDLFADQMIVTEGVNGPAVAVMRLMDQQMADRAGGYYSAQEFDLGPVLASGMRCLELGRMCLHPAFRGGTAFVALWGGLAEYILARQIELLFGVASFHGTDTSALAAPLSLLHHRHLAPEHLRVTALPDQGIDMDMIPIAKIDRRSAIVAVPSLIKAYLRMGGTVGHGAWVDHAFKTTDVCMIMETDQLNSHYAARFAAANGAL